jgi:pyridoxal phosphate enzyme (YggS family)
MSITENYRKLRAAVPSPVRIVVAAKQRTPAEVAEVIQAGATDIGENYVQEATALRKHLGKIAARVRWHMIGHLQTNKINKALPLFDVIQTIDAFPKAEAIDKRVEAAGKEVIPVYIEINVGSELSKSGLGPDFKQLEQLTRAMAALKHLRLEGLMTMGPRFGDFEHSRPYFRQVRELFEQLQRLKLPHVTLDTLSMGMSDSWEVAVEEGCNMVRIGTAIFGLR